MKKIFYIIALGVGLAGCSNNEDELLSTGSFPEDHVIRIITEVNEPLSRAGYDVTNLERFGLMIRNSENAAYNYHKQMVSSGNAWSTSDGQQMLWDAERTPVTMIAYAPYMSEAAPDASLVVNALTNQTTEENVKSSDFQVTALGTEFNVTAYPDEDEVTATLISGKVLVEYNGQKNQEVLNPNEQLAYNKRTRSGNVVRPDMQDITAWQRGEIVFRSMTLEEIFTRLERKYPYTFVYSFRSLKGDRFNLTFGQNASIEEIMDIVARVTGNLNYQIVGDKCYVSAIAEGTLHYRRTK